MSDTNRCPLKCPMECGRVIPPKHKYVCPTCWWMIPAQDRVKLHRHHSRGHNVDSMLTRIVREFKMAHPSVIGVAIMDQPPAPSAHGKLRQAETILNAAETPPPL